MGRKIYPLFGIKYWYCYDIDDICHLYQKYNLHPQTVRQWIKAGLPIIDSGKPALIYGSDLKEFLGKSNQSNKCKTDFEQIFCFKCKEGKSPYRKQVQLEHTKGFVKAKAHCQGCKSTMYKSYKLDDLSKLKSFFHVVDVLELYDSKDSTVKTHITAQDDARESEPAQGELF